MTTSSIIPAPIGYSSSPGVSEKPAKEDHSHIIDVEDWISPPLLNSWTPGTTTQELRYLKDPMGFVHIEGTIVQGGVVAAGTDLFILPVGYRPKEPLRTVQCTNSGSTFITVMFHPDGVVEIGPVAAIGNISFLCTFEANRDILDITRS